MELIYEPKGKAKEYAGLAFDIYKGCTHGCLYCFEEDEDSGYRLFKRYRVTWSD